jgi:hypothetical protein
MLHALEQIRRMRGGAQSHLMRCSDGNYYVVKFQNNPQHRRILVNELLGTRLAGRLGLPTTRVEIVHVGEELIGLTPELCMQLAHSQPACQAGLQFASQYPGDPRRLTLFDFLPDPQLRNIENLRAFAGMLVFDKWTCNTDGRQTIFYREERKHNQTNEPNLQAGLRIDEGHEHGDGSEECYKATMIDQGFCFNAGEWNFPDAPLRGLYARNRVYETVTGMESFAEWLRRLESGITDRVLQGITQEIPPEWYDDDFDALMRLLEQLYRRIPRVPDLLLAAKNTTRQPFPNWR